MTTSKQQWPRWQRKAVDSRFEARRIVLAWCVFLGCLGASRALAQVGGYFLRVSASPISGASNTVKTGFSAISSDVLVALVRCKASRNTHG